MLSLSTSPRMPRLAILSFRGKIPQAGSLPGTMKSTNMTSFTVVPEIPKRAARDEDVRAVVPAIIIQGKDYPMRRLLSIFAVVVLSSFLVGCRASNGCGVGGCGSDSGCSAGCGGGRGPITHAHGICDNEYDDHCSTRSPWIRTSMTPAQAPISSESLTPPAKLPDGKKAL